MSRWRGLAWLPVTALGVAVLGYYGYRYLQPLPLDDADRAALVMAKDIGFTAKPENESFEKRRLLDSATKVHYHAKGLGKRELSTIDGLTFDYSSDARAVIGFRSIKIGGSSGFAMAASANEKMVARDDVHFDWADDIYWADYRVDDKIVGAFVLARTGHVVHFVSLNAIITDPQKLEHTLHEHWAH